MKIKLIILLNFALALHAQAGSAIWNLNPLNGNWEG